MDEVKFSKSLKWVLEPLGTVQGDSTEAGMKSALSFSKDLKKLVGQIRTQDLTNVQKTVGVLGIATAGALVLWGLQSAYRKLKPVADAEDEEIEVEVYNSDSIPNEIKESKADSESAIDLHINAQSIILTQDQWKRLLEQILKVEAMKQFLIQILKSAEMSDGDPDSLEWQRNLESLSNEEINQKFQITIQENPEILESSEVQEILKLLFRDGPDDGTAALGTPTR